MSTAPTYSFTTTEELILDMLQARIRLGENIWNFDFRLKPSIEKLQTKGLINFKGGNVENTLLAWPTEEGKVLFFGGSFTERIGSKKFAKRQEKLHKEAKALKKARKKKIKIHG